ALESVLFSEPLLHRVKRSPGSQAFDRGDLATLRLYGEDRAGLHGPSIQQHRARPALARVAPDVGPGEPEALSDELNEEEPRLHILRSWLAVHGELNAMERTSLVLNRRHSMRSRRSRVSIAGRHWATLELGSRPSLIAAKNSRSSISTPLRETSTFDTSMGCSYPSTRSS